MGFFKKSARQNYDVFSGYAWYVPGVAGMFALLGWLLVGALLGNLLSGVFLLGMGSGAIEYATLLAYPVMFIPAMVASKYVSNRNMLFENGYAVDSAHFGSRGGWLLALLCMVATVGAAFCMDLVNSLMPAMPDWLEKTLESMTGGRFWVNFLCVSIFAPIFEEWLCRGMVLRGLLNCRRPDGSRGLKPLWAIVISAAFFAAIHGNPWQAVPAFALGLLFGYVYYRTGSLRLTMLMHFTNNTLALAMSQFADLDSADTWMDVLPTPAYIGLFVCFAVFLFWFVKDLAKIATVRPQGNCDEIPFDEIGK